MSWLKIWRWLRLERMRLARYFLIGVTAVIIDNGLYGLLTRFFASERRLANMFSVGVGAAFAFFFNKFWSFQQQQETVRQARRFLALFIFNYFFAQIIFWVAAHLLGFYDFAVKIIIIAAQVTWNFLLYRYWIYGVGNSHTGN